MLDRVLDLWDIVPDYDLDIMTPDQTLSGIAATVLQRLEPVLQEVHPDLVLVQGDTTTAMAASLAAFHGRIPVGHVEAGLRTWDKTHPYPEEINRRIVGLLADRHYAPTAWAADNLRREGVSENAIVTTGNTVIDAFLHVLTLPFEPRQSPLSQISVDQRRLALVTVHRRENHGKRLQQICKSLTRLAGCNPDVRIVIPVHPNPRVCGPLTAALRDVTNITLLPPLDYQPMAWLLKRSHLVITDSGGLQEEATGIGKPVLILRDTTERPEGVTAGSARLVGADPEKIFRESQVLLRDEGVYASMAHAHHPYGDGTAAERIIEDLLTSHNVIDLTEPTPQVRRTFEEPQPYGQSPQVDIRGLDTELSR